MKSAKRFGWGVLASLSLAMQAAPSLAQDAPPPDATKIVSSTTTTGVLTLDALVKSVDERFPTILAAEQDRIAAEADRLSAAGGFDPSVRTSAAVIPLGGYPSQRLDVAIEQPLPFWGSSVFAGYRIGRGDFPVYDGKLATNDGGEVRAGARVNLWRDGSIDRRRATIERASLGTDIAKKSMEQQRIDAVRVASFRYWDWVGAGRRHAIAQTFLDLALFRDGAIGKRVEKGDVPAFEKQENERAILQRRAQVVSAKRSLEQAAIELSLFLRTQEGAAILPDPAQLPSEIPAPSPLSRASIQQDERAALERRPEIERLEAQKKQAEVERRWAENQSRPAIDLVVVGSKDLGAGDPKLDKPVVEAAIMVDIPILNRVARGREQAASAQMARIDAQTRLQRDRVVADVRDAASALSAAEERVSMAQSELEVAKKLAEQELRRFELGEGTLLLVNLREQAALEAAQRHVDALIDWQKARAAYRAATAGATSALP